jgi:isopentenyl phosphate kinase
MIERPCLVFVKLGGSLITDKNVEATIRPGVIRRLAEEVRCALDQHPDLSLLMGHGSGSFGHVVAQRYRVQTGCTDWDGYALTSAAATRLNRVVTDAFLHAGVPVVSIQPSASARCREGELVALAVHPIQEVLEHGLVPLVYGDVALDEVWGTTIISTEAIFVYLARILRPERILLMGEVEGVYSADPRRDPQAHLIPVVNASRMEEPDKVLGGSHGVDVTGGMRSKVQLMVDLVRHMPELHVRLLSGLQPGLLEGALGGAEFNAGTLIKV